MSSDRVKCEYIIPQSIYELMDLSATDMYPDHSEVQGNLYILTYYEADGGSIPRLEYLLEKLKTPYDWNREIWGSDDIECGEIRYENGARNELFSNEFDRYDFDAKQFLKEFEENPDLAIVSLKNKVKEQEPLINLSNATLPTPEQLLFLAAKSNIESIIKNCLKNNINLGYSDKIENKLVTTADLLIQKKNPFYEPYLKKHFLEKNNSSHESSINDHLGL